jgi:hypothetical protein
VRKRASMPAEGIRDLERPSCEAEPMVNPDVGAALAVA